MRLVIPGRDGPPGPPPPKAVPVQGGTCGFFGTVMDGGEVDSRPG